MGKLDLHLQRLFKLAAPVKEEEVSGAPFGFDTRVLGQWRVAKNNGANEVARFVRRVALVAIAITLFGGVAAYRQISENEEMGEPLTNDYAIADSAIERQFLQ
jgi:hypothetical protein